MQKPQIPLSTLGIYLTFSVPNACPPAFTWRTPRQADIAIAKPFISLVVKARVAAGAVLACLCLVALSFAQPGDHKSDAHLNDPAAQLYTQSPFAHGYIHGYEDGFHTADQDLQFGRINRGVRGKMPAHPDANIETTDRGSFRKGYEQGFGAGYRDSAAGREFRAVAALREAALALQSGNAPANDPAFDHAFREGYFSGETYASRFPKPITDFNYVAAYCAAHVKGMRSVADGGKPPQSECPAYTQGFRIGYADVRIQQPAQTTASTK